MIDLKQLVQDPEPMRASIAARGLQIDVDAMVQAVTELGAARQELEALLRQMNQIARAPPNPAGARGPSEEARACKQAIQEQKQRVGTLEAHLQAQALLLPNYLSPEVPAGIDDTENQVLRTCGTVPQFDFVPRDHLQLGLGLDWIDFEAGARVAGAKFYFLKHEAVFLQHALKSWVFRLAHAAGFIPLHTPDLVRESVLLGAGFAPRGAESNVYTVEDTGLALIATAEIPVGGMHAGEILDPAHLPLRYVAESHCFRRESGASGQAGKGLYRVHQFEKVELFVLCQPEDSARIHAELLAFEEEIYTALGLPYRVLQICAGDMGAPAYQKYDIEAWMPGKGASGAYGEVTSTSNCTDYQARRLQIRYAGHTRNPFVHTLNGTAIACSRVLLALMECFQTAEGGVRIPEVLVPYCGMTYVPPRNSGSMRGGSTRV